MMLDEPNTVAGIIVAVGGILTSLVYAITEYRKTTNLETRVTKLETQMEERKK